MEFRVERYGTFVRACALASAFAALAMPAAAECWSGGAKGQGVPRESLLVINQAPFAVHVMAGPVNGERRILGQVPAGTTMSFPSVLPPGRNETAVWADPADAERYKLATARTRGLITIVNRRDLTCRRAAQLTITPAVFEARRRTGTDVARARRDNLSTLAPAAGPRRAATPPASTPARQPGPPGGGAGVVRY